MTHEWTDRTDRTPTDAALDREIEVALAVKPSPEFQARVRTRIAIEPAPSSWRLPWFVAAAGAMAALIAIAIVVSRPREVSPVFAADRMPLPARTVAPFWQPLAGAHGIMPVVHVASGFPAVERGAGSRTTAHSAGAPLTVRLKPDATEVLLDPAETRALRRLIAGTRDGTLDLSPSLQATTPTAMDLPPLSEIAIPLITIDPITPQAGDEGARQ